MQTSSPREPLDRSTNDIPLRTFLASEQLKLTYLKGAYPYVTSIINAALYAAVVWKEVPRWRLVGWLCLIGVAAVSRVVMPWLYARRDHRLVDLQQWARINILGAGIHGLVWGSAAFAVYPEHSPAGQLLLVFVSGGMAAGASTLNASHLPSCLAFVIPDTAPLSARLLAQPDWPHRAMGIMLFMFAGFMVSLARSSNHAAKEGIELRYRLATLSRLATRRADELELFAGRVAHDILGPLTSAKMALGYIAKRATDPADVSMVARGNRGVERVCTIVDGLLRFARAGARPEPGLSTMVRPALEAIMAELEPIATEARTLLVLDPVPECVVACNVGVLTSLVENLLRNAIKYMGDRETRRVELRVEACRDVVRFEVEDTGPGIEPLVLDGLFEPYVRGHDRTLPGIGLGLATVRRISEAHGGRVGARSTVGLGSTFWFELPKALEPTKSATNEGQAHVVEGSDCST